VLVIGSIADLFNAISESDHKYLKHFKPEDKRRSAMYDHMPEARTLLEQISDELMPSHEHLSNAVQSSIQTFDRYYAGIDKSLPMLTESHLFDKDSLAAVNRVLQDAVDWKMQFHTEYRGNIAKTVSHHLAHVINDLAIAFGPSQEQKCILGFCDAFVPGYNVAQDRVDLDKIIVSHSKSDLAKTDLRCLNLTPEGLLNVYLMGNKIRHSHGSHHNYSAEMYVFIRYFSSTLRRHHEDGMIVNRDLIQTIDSVQPYIRLYNDALKILGSEVTPRSKILEMLSGFSKAKGIEKIDDMLTQAQDDLLDTARKTCIDAGLKISYMGTYEQATDKFINLYNQARA